MHCNVCYNGSFQTMIRLTQQTEKQSWKFQIGTVWVQTMNTVQWTVWIKGPVDYSTVGKQEHQSFASCTVTIRLIPLVSRVLRLLGVWSSQKPFWSHSESSGSNENSGSSESNKSGEFIEHLEVHRTNSVLTWSSKHPQRCLLANY